jgi:hypothetical protein
MVISCITPEPEEYLPTNLSVAIDVEMLGVLPPEDVIGGVAPTDETPPPPPEGDELKKEFELLLSIDICKFYLLKLQSCN